MSTKPTPEPPRVPPEPAQPIATPPPTKEELQGKKEDLEQKKVDKEAVDTLEAASKILKKYGGEANVPYSSEYWGLMNHYRGLTARI